VALPINEVELERWLSNAIKTLLETVSSVGQVHVTERYASNDEEDEALFTTPDPVLGLGSNVTHYFLQQHSVTTIQNEKGEAVEHEAEWSLTVTISGIKF
jgi:hypothetical protein